MASRKAELDDELKRLHGLPLGEFTAARNALAKQLDKAGKKKEADEVKALPKPTPSAWVVNQLFARETGKMDRLLGAGERARAAQREAVAGAGAERLRETLAAARDVAEELRQRAVAILSQEGRAPSRVVTDRVATNLQALAFSPAAAEEASRGWLSRDLDPPGFEVFTGLKFPARVVNIESRRKERPEPAPAPEPEPPRKPEKRAAKVSKTEEAAERRRRAAEEKREAAERARREREAEKRRERVARAEERVERAAAEEDFLRRKAEQSEKIAEDARRRAEEARDEADQARRRADRAAEALARAREALAEVREAGRDAGKAAR